jgi:arylsulfatase A-like enzyme
VNYSEKVGTDFTGKENPELLKMEVSPNQGHLGTIVNGISRMGWMAGGKKARWVDETLASDFTNEAEVFVEKNREHPFFLYMALSDIHVPRMPDTRFKGKSGLGYRGDAILQMDYTVGRLMTKLDELRLTSNTLVIFTSDNGPVLNDAYLDGAVPELNGHTPWGNMRGGKYSILEAGTRIPFILHWPGQVKPGESNALVSQVDLLASFAAMTGQELIPGSGQDSTNMLDAFLGKSATGRKSLVVSAKTLAFIKGDWKYIEPHEGPALLREVNIESGLSTDPQLYNLKNDIAEKTNLAKENPELVKQLAGELADIKSQGNEQ